MNVFAWGKPPIAPATRNETLVTSHPVLAIRSFFMMYWLDLKGSQGIFLLPVMVGLGLFASSNRFEDGVVLWKVMNFSAVEAYTFIAPVTSGFAAWTASRDRRRGLDRFIGYTPGNPLTRDLAMWCATASWGVLGYGIVAACFGSLGYVRATWGGPDLDLVSTGALGIVLAAAIGILIGRHVPSRFSPLLAILPAYAAIFASDILGQVGLRIRIPGLSPLDFAWTVGTDIYRQPADDLVFPGLLWLGGLIGVAVAGMALARRRATIGTLVGVLSIAVASIGGNALVHTEDALRNRVPVPYDATCATQDGIDVCVHPAFAPLLGHTMQIVDGMVSPLAGLDGVRTHWTHGEGSSESRPDADPVQFRRLRGFNPAVDVANDLFPDNRSREGVPSRPASQLVILTWLAERAGIGNPAGWTRDDLFAIGAPAGWAFGYPSESLSHQEGNAYASRQVPDDADLATWQGEIDAAAARFATLPPTAQRAWLEANWDALRAGDLTLEDLP